jgi:DNA-binding transcriptional ArsR family regulator
MGLLPRQSHETPPVSESTKEMANKKEDSGVALLKADTREEALRSVGEKRVELIMKSVRRDLTRKNGQTFRINDIEDEIVSLQLKAFGIEKSDFYRKASTDYSLLVALGLVFRRFLEEDMTRDEAREMYEELTAGEIELDEMLDELSKVPFQKIG